MSVWRDLPKIDAHVHVVHHPRDDGIPVNPPERMVEVMARERVERALVMPSFDPEPGTRDDPPRAQNRRQARLAEAHPDHFLCLAAALDDTHCLSRAREVVGFVESSRLVGVKIHPTTGTPADSWALVPLYRALADRGLPVLIHSNPSDNDPLFDDSSPARIGRVAAAFPDLKLIVGHLGGSHFMQCLGLEQHGHFEISGGLLILAQILGLDAAERFLRRLGVDRLLFATDYPLFAYTDYYEVLDAMHWTAQERERIAYANAAALLGL